MKSLPFLLSSLEKCTSTKTLLNKQALIFQSAIATRMHLPLQSHFDCIANSSCLVFRLNFSQSLAIFTLITFQGLLAFPAATKDLNNKLYGPPIALLTQKADKMPLSTKAPHTINYFPPLSTFGQRPDHFPLNTKPLNQSRWATAVTAGKWLIFPAFSFYFCLTSARLRGHQG